MEYSGYLQNVIYITERFSSFFHVSIHACLFLILCNIFSVPF